jgi:hypothetical protein
MKASFRIALQVALFFLLTAGTAWLSLIKNSNPGVFFGVLAVLCVLYTVAVLQKERRRANSRDLIDSLIRELLDVAKPDTRLSCALLIRDGQKNPYRYLVICRSMERSTGLHTFRPHNGDLIHDVMREGKQTTRQNGNDHWVATAVSNYESPAEVGAVLLTVVPADLLSMLQDAEMQAREVTPLLSRCLATRRHFLPEVL